MAARRRRVIPPEVLLAAELRRGGDWLPQFENVLHLTEEGSGGAAAIAAQVYAALGEWEACLTQSARYFADPSVGQTGNLFTELSRLARRAAVTELGDGLRLSPLAASVPTRWHAMRDATMLRDHVPPSAQPGPAQPEVFAAALAEAEGHRRFRGRPRELAAHAFALAMAFKMEAEALARFEAEDGWAWWDVAVQAARLYARRGEGERAWQVLWARLSGWTVMDALFVVPLELYVDPWLGPLVTPERSRALLAQPRAVPRE